MTAVRAVLFDVGQTLLEYPGNRHEFWRTYLEEQLGKMRGLLSDMGAQSGGSESTTPGLPCGG